MNDIIKTAKDLLESGTVEYIIGYRQGIGNQTKPFIAHTPQDAEKFVFNNYCLNNLAVYLNRLDLAEGKKVGIFAKGCDVRAITMLIQESQISRDSVYIIGMNCSGVVKDFDFEWKLENIAPKCTTCTVHTPKIYDVLLGELEELSPAASKAGEIMAKFDAMTAQERWSWWESQFEKCIKCCACRQACPLCYCEQCIVDKNMPQWIETSASKRGNFSWNIIRAFHQSGRCIGCGECDRVCPMDIPLSLLNMKMGMISRTEFGYMPGMSLDEPTLVGTYKFEDKEDFIK